jgi:ATP-dependent RNA helicase DeaD
VAPALARQPMEPVLSSEPVADERTAPATEPEAVPSAQPIAAAPPEPTPDERHTAELVAEIDAAEDEDIRVHGPDHEDRPPPETDPAMTFADLKLIRPLFEAITHAGYEHPTPVQEAVIPVAMRGKDVIGQAQTGTGKTAAFLVPFMNRWRPHTLKGPIGLVMTPTRELALQVATEAEKLAPSRKFRTVAVYGGARMGRQLQGLGKGCDLVVGTPGRMLDHLRRGSMSLHDVKYAVLDEADRMLDIGFRPDIERILKRCPSYPDRQTLLMSATVPDEIKRLVNRYMHEPIHLQMTPSVVTVEKIRQSYFTVDVEKKFDLLTRVIEREQPRQCLIFVERKRWADNLYRDLKRVVPAAAVIHGDLAQSLRERIMAAFRTGEIRYLIATDVMSRGIDVTDITHVVNFDLPQDIDNYVHRIGRTGRIGKDGIAISFVTPEQGELLTNIEMVINRLIDRDEIPGEWYTPRKLPPKPEHVSAPPPEPVVERDAEGWGVIEHKPEPPPAAPAEKKSVFGKPKKRYSNRL